MVKSIRSPEYKEAKRRARYGGATLSIENQLSDFTDAAASALQTQVDAARKRNASKTATRTPYNFPAAVARNVRRGMCACGNSVTDADHIVPIEYAGKMTRKIMVILSEYFNSSEIADMPVADFLKSATNAQGLCNHCNNMKRDRFIATRNQKGFSIVAFLDNEKEIAKKLRGNDHMREIKAAFSSEIAAAKRKIRKAAAKVGEKIDERTLNASNYPALKEIENRRATCLRHGEYVAKSYFKAFLKSLEA